MKALRQLQHGIDIRSIKYAEFQAFFDGAESLFTAFITRDFGKDPPISITVKSGGRQGGQDKRLVEVFFGSVPYDTIDYEDRGLAKNASAGGHRILCESGPCLFYQRADTGDVVCILQPAVTDEHKTSEDMIVLQTVSRPCTLNALAHCHWQDLLAYRECTSVNGAPSHRQRLRYFCLRHFRRYGSDHKAQPARVPNSIKQLGIITASFILGGVITTTIEKHIFSESVQPQHGASAAKNPIVTSKCQTPLPAQHAPEPSVRGKKQSTP